MPTALERFKAKVATFSHEDDCWVWTGAKDDRGYGRFKFEGFVWYAHRWAWEHIVGPIPDGLQIDHMCRIPSCVNPAHLRPATPAENSQARVAAVAPMRPSPAGTPLRHARSRPSRSLLYVSPSP